MSRKKAINQQELFTCSIRTRVTQKDLEKLEKIKASSDCGSIGEVARKILSNEKINCFYRDISLNAPMEEMVEIMMNETTPFRRKLTHCFGAN